MRLAILQSAALLTGVAPLGPRMVAPVPPGPETEPRRGDDRAPADRATAGSGVAARRPDELWLSPAARPEPGSDAGGGGRDRAVPGDAREPAADGSAPRGAPAAPPPAGSAGTSGTSGARPTTDDAANAPRARGESAEAAGTAAGGEGSTGARGVDGEPLSDREQRRVEELRARDAEVRAHEQAHKSVGGRYAGAISYEYTEGPDGRRYATGGSVPIDASPVRGDPEATVAKMQVVRAAALAPAEPSPQDRRVAAQADRTASRARQEMARDAMAAGGDGGVSDAEPAAGAARTERPAPPSADQAARVVPAPPAAPRTTDDGPAPAIEVPIAAGAVARDRPSGPPRPAAAIDAAPPTPARPIREASPEAPVAASMPPNAPRLAPAPPAGLAPADAGSGPNVPEPIVDPLDPVAPGPARLTAGDPALAAYRRAAAGPAPVVAPTLDLRG